jgi:hypothetical protein
MRSLGKVAMVDCNLRCMEASFEDFNPVPKQSGTKKIYDNLRLYSTVLGGVEY